jgi:dTDP-4-dehydrorhamnose 3,5-epimerase-like enzyme
MQFGRLEEMLRGWFVGPFAPTMFHCDGVEVAVKHYAAGDTEGWHYHHVATEITAIISGAAVMADRRLEAGAIICLAPGEGSDFSALEDTVTVVVKVPAVHGDKHLHPRPAADPP